MNNSEHKKITLIVNGCTIQLSNGSVLNVNSYRADRLGIYVLLENTARHFANLEGLVSKEKKLCYIPYEKIDVIVYDVAGNDTKGEESSMDDEPDQPLG